MPGACMSEMQAPDVHESGRRIHRMRACASVEHRRGALRTLLCVLAVAVSCVGCGGAKSPGDEERAAQPAFDCPNSPEICPAVTEWIHGIAIDAGYRPTGGSAWEGTTVAHGDGNEAFYIWGTATTATEQSPEPRAWRMVARVGDVSVYADRAAGAHRWWIAQGFVIHVRPELYGVSRAPEHRGLLPLIRASQLLPAPRLDERLASG
jgi:hypothetical protein